MKLFITWKTVYADFQKRIIELCPKCEEGPPVFVVHGYGRMHPGGIVCKASDEWDKILNDPSQ